MTLFLEPTQRGFICGRSGSGKSVAACWLLFNSPITLPLYIFDTKGEDTLRRCFDMAPVITTASKFKKYRYSKVVIYQPKPQELDESFLDEVLYSMYLAKRPCTIYLDETLDFMPRFSRGGNGIVSLATRGRSLGMTLFAGTQRPAWISRYLISEANHHYIFDLQLKDDRKQVGDWSGIQDVPRMAPYHFIHHDAATDTCEFFSPVPLHIAPETRYRFTD